MRFLRVIAVLGATIGLAGCPNLEKTSRDALAASKGVLTTYQNAYKSTCLAKPAQSSCTLIHNGIAAQDTAIDALTVYCSNPTVKPAFADGGPCAPQKQFAGALQSALQNLNQIVKDVRGLPAQPAGGQ